MNSKLIKIITFIKNIIIKVKILVESIRNTFGKLIRNNTDVLDNTTRSIALDKSAAIQTNVAFPDWLLNNEKLDKIYKLVNLNFIT